MIEQPKHDDGTPLPEITGYRLLRKLNDGGMSTVYLARQHSLGRDVAIKVMSPVALGDEVSRRRFENEVRTIARLEHPHVVRIHEVGRTHEGLPYYAMPYMARGHLGQRVQGQVLGPVLLHVVDDPVDPVLVLEPVPVVVAHAAHTLAWRGRRRPSRRKVARFAACG